MRQDYVNARFLEWWSYHPRLLKDDIFPDWMKYECGIDDPMGKTVQMIHEGYLRVGTPKEQLDRMTVAELKEIADKQGLSVGKKKQDIIECILSSGNDEWRKYIDVAVAITNKGLEYIGGKKDLANKNVKSIEEYLIRNDKGKIIGVDHKKYAADFNKNTSPFSLISSTLIQEIIDTDIFAIRDLSQYGVSHTEENCEQLKAILIWSELTGKGEKEIAIDAAKYFGINTQETQMLVRTEGNYFNTQNELKSLTEAGITEYEFMALPSDETCEICKSLDDKRFPVSKAVIGVNCPPMHIGCRCTIGAVTETPEEIQEDIEKIIDSWNIPEGMSFDEFVDCANNGELEKIREEQRATAATITCPSCASVLDANTIVRFCPKCGAQIK